MSAVGPIGWLAGIFGLAALVTWLANRLLLTRAARLLAVDRPNARSLHEHPTPRGGGLGIGLALLVAAGAIYALGAGSELAPVFAPMLAIGAISFLDDHRPLPAWVRLAVHLGAAIGWLVLAGEVNGVTLPGGSVALGPLARGTLAVLWLVWATNLYNFMDGMDGFAGGMGAIGFAALGGLGVGAALTGAHPLALGGGLNALAFAASGACVGFLLVNFPPAKIFMGDVGSSMLGFLAGAMILSGELTGGIPLWIGMLVFSPFIVDASVTLGRRLVRGERVWEAHHTHYYQRLVRLGWGHRRTVLVEYVLMLACALSALAAGQLSERGQIGLAFAWGAVYLVLMIAVHGLERRQLRREGSQ